MSIKEQHLVIIIDNENKIPPKKYCCDFNKMSQQEAINDSKKAYEKKYNNFTYQSYYFKHEI